MESKLQNLAGATKTETQVVGGNSEVKKGSTVFPAKKRLVKTMVFDSIVKSICSILCSNEAGPMISPSQPKIPDAGKCNQNQIFPHPDYPNPNHDDKSWAPPVQSTGVF